MTRLEFDRMVETLEIRYQGKNTLLTRSAVSWAVLGYSVLIVGLLGSLAIVLICAGTIFWVPNLLTIKLCGIFGIGAFLVGLSILRGSWVRLSPPQGYEVRRQDATALFDMIDSTAAKAGGINFNRVLLTDDLNASVTQVPMLGIFGFYRNYLCLGVPLMDALSPEEFHAVLAHEFAHLSRSHGRTGNWLYRIRVTWENVAQSLSTQSGMLVRPFQMFIDWFWPRFNARAFVLSRANEYEADAFSAATTSPKIAASALQRIAVVAMRLDEHFWSHLDRRSLAEPKPPASIFHEISSLLKTQLEPAESRRWISQKLSMVTDTSDTHPALSQRISALGIAPEVIDLEPLLQSSSDILLGSDFASGVRQYFSGMWLKNHGENWENGHQQGVKNRQRLQELETAPPSEANLWEILSLHCRADGVAARREDLEKWVEEHPAHGISRFVLGSYLLSINANNGIRHLEVAIETNPENTMECLGEMAAYHSRNGNTDAFQHLKVRADDHDSRMLEARRERNAITPRDNFGNHGQSEVMIACHQKILSTIPEVQQAWLVKKTTREFAAWDHFVVVIHFKFPALSFQSENAIPKLLQRVADGIDMNAHFLVVNDKGPFNAAAQVVKNSPGSLIYTKEP